MNIVRIQGHSRTHLLTLLLSYEPLDEYILLRHFYALLERILKNLIFWFFRKEVEVIIDCYQSSQFFFNTIISIKYYF